MSKPYIEKLYDSLKNCSDAELIHRMRIGTDQQKVVAERILTERKTDIADFRHKQQIAENRKSNRLAIIAIVISFLSLILAVFALFSS